MKRDNILNLWLSMLDEVIHEYKLSSKDIILNIIKYMYNVSNLLHYYVPIF